MSAKEVKLAALESKIEGLQRTINASSAPTSASTVDKEKEAARLRGCVRDAAEENQVLNQLLLLLGCDLA